MALAKKYVQIHTLLLFVVDMYWLILPISFKVASLALVESYDFPSGSEATLEYMGKITDYMPTTKHNKMWTCAYFLGNAVFMLWLWLVISLNKIIHNSYVSFADNNKMLGICKLCTFLAQQ